MAMASNHWQMPLQARADRETVVGRHPNSGD
jgi:hypothetical protein